jgi:hypothetical protein
MNQYELATLSAATTIMNADSERVLECLGAHLAAKHKYPLEGISAVHYHLIQKHNWLPRDVKSLSIEDMKLACAMELADMKPTDDLVDFQQALSIASSNMISSLPRPS